MNVAIRGTGIQTGTSASYTVNWPAGTVSGDLAVIQVGHAFSVNTPVGWTSANTLSGSNWNGATLYKVLDGTDITAGHVVITTGGSFNGVIAITTIQTGTFNASTVPICFAVRSGGGASTATLTSSPTGNAANPDRAHDLMLYFGSNRGASTNTVSLGANQQQANDGSAASGCLYTENSTTDIPSPTYSFSSAGSGYYVSALCVQAPATVPIWIRGTGIQASSASSYTVSWPAGTVAGDTAVIIIGGGFTATTPAGWTNIDNSAGSGWNGSAFYRVLNSTDISAGNVTVSMGGTFDSVVSIATIPAASLSGYANPVATASRHGSGSPSSETLNYTSSNTTDYVLLFGSFRQNANPAYPTCSLNDLQNTATDGSASCGCLYAGSPASVGTISPAFHYNSTANNGDYQVAILFVGSSAASSGNRNLPIVSLIRNFPVFTGRNSPTP